MKTESRTSAIIVVAGTVLFTTLLSLKQIGQPSYVVLMCVLALVGIVLYGFNRIREVDLKNLKVTLDKIEQMRDEVYAKTDTLRKLAEDLAEIATMLATDRIPQLIEWGPKALATRYEREAIRFTTKQRVVSILLSTGVEQSRIEAVQNLFDARIRRTLRQVLFSWLHSHANRVLDNRRQAFQKEFAALRERGIKQTDPEYKDCLMRCQETDKECQALKDYISQPALERVFHESDSGLSALAKHLQAKGISSPEIDRHLTEFEAFIKKYPIDMKAPEHPPAN